jgi:hypothetical protein
MEASDCGILGRLTAPNYIAARRMTAPPRKRSLLLIAGYIVAPFDDCCWCERTSIAHRAVPARFFWREEFDSKEYRVVVR